MFGMTLFGCLFAAWGAATTALVFAMICRSLVGFGEEDQIFLSPGDASMETEQQVVQQRMKHLDRYVHAFGAASGALLAVMLAWVGVQVAQQFS